MRATLHLSFRCNPPVLVVQLQNACTPCFPALVLVLLGQILHRRRLCSVPVLVKHPHNSSPLLPSTSLLFLGGAARCLAKFVCLCSLFKKDNMLLGFLESKPSVRAKCGFFQLYSPVSVARPSTVLVLESESDFPASFAKLMAAPVSSPILPDCLESGRMGWPNFLCI